MILKEADKLNNSKILILIDLTSQPLSRNKKILPAK